VEHPSDKVRRRALKLFTERVRGVRSELSDALELPARVREAKLRQAAEAAARACALAPPLLRPPPPGAAGADTAADADGGNSPLTRQMALLALGAVAAEFGAQQEAALMAAVPAVLAAARDPHAAVRASALAAVAALVRALGARMVPLLPATVAATVAAADAACARLERAGAASKRSAGSEAEPCDTLPDSDDEADEGAPAQREARGDAEDAALELAAALAALAALVERLGGFLSPHLPALLAILLNPRVLACTTAGCDRFAAAVRERLPAAVPPRLLLPALYQRLQPCLDAAADALSAQAAAAPAAALLAMLATAAAAMEPKAAAQHADAMFAFLLRALDVRQRRPAALAAHGEAALDGVEAAAVRGLVALVMKLSEARFKPLFLRLVEWSSALSTPESPPGAEPGYLGRMAALFAAASALTERLRGVMVPYFRYLMASAAQHLGAGEELAAGGRRGRKKQRRGGPAVLAEAEAESEAGGVALRLAWLLRLRVVRALHRAFLHDRGGALADAERVSALLPHLVAQLEAEPPAAALPGLRAAAAAEPDLAAATPLGADTAAYTAPDGERSAGPLGAAAVGALLAMAVAANSDVQWKPLNHAGLMLTRSTSPRVRALGLELAAQLAERLREEYLVLLPESLPFAAELLEDGDAAVATRVRQFIALLEEVSGEKLDEYLKI
jgi:U3 small nucleolar RNA-associated protein 10